MMSAPSLGALTRLIERDGPGIASRTRKLPLAAPSHSPTLATLTIRCTPTLVRKSNVSSIDEATGSSSPCSGMCTNTDAPESCSTCVVSALVCFRAMGTAIAPHIHVAFIATSNSGPGIADMATPAPLSASAGGVSCAIVPAALRVRRRASSRRWRAWVRERVGVRQKRPVRDFDTPRGHHRDVGRPLGRHVGEPFAEGVERAPSRGVGTEGSAGRDPPREVGTCSNRRRRPGRREAASRSREHRR